MKKLLIIAITLAACNSKPNTFSSSNSNNEQNKKGNYITPLLHDTDSMFINHNYFKISNLYSGEVFTDSLTNQSAFFRIVEIQQEEHLLLYVEKISVGNEGGNFKLIERYPLKESMFSFNEFSMYKLDSVSFIDSVTLIGNFNKQKFQVDLMRKKAILMQ